MMNRQKTRGLVAAPLTPLRTDGTLHLEAVDSYAQWLRANAVIGAFICGTTGEGLSLTVAERRRVAERWMSAAPAGFRVMVHVGHNSLEDSRELAAHAAEIGADSFACMAPFFFKPGGVEALIRWCEQVASAAPSLPFYYYHMPSVTGMNCRVSDFLSEGSERIPNLVGIKFTHDDLADYERCLRLQGGRFDVLFGRDELLLSVLRMGAHGAVGSTYNFAAPLYREIIEAHGHSDDRRASRLQDVATRMIEVLAHGDVHPIAAFKWFMGRIAVDCGPSRLPLLDPTSEQAAALESRLQETGIFDWVERKPCVSGAPA